MINHQNFLTTPLTDFSEASFSQIFSAKKHLDRIVKSREDQLIQAILDKDWTAISKGLEWFGKNIQDHVLDNFYKMQLDITDVSQAKIFLSFEFIRKDKEKFYHYLFSFLNNVQYLNELQIEHPNYISQIVFENYKKDNFSSISDDLLRRALLQRFNLEPDISTLSYCITNKNYNYFVETIESPLVKNFLIGNKTKQHSLLIDSVAGNTIDIFMYLYNKYQPDLNVDFLNTIIKDSITIGRILTNQVPPKFQIFCDSFKFTPEICHNLVASLLKSQKYDNINYFLVTIHNNFQLLEATKAGCMNFPNDPFKIHLLSFIDKCSLYTNLDNHLADNKDNIINKPKIKI